MTDFLDLESLSPGKLRAILDAAAKRKQARTKAGPCGKGAPDGDAPLSGCVLALVFEKPSTRTRVSFNIAMRQLGGASLDLGGAVLQLQHGESIGDTAKVLSRYVDAIVFRTDDHKRLEALSRASEIPVINGLSDRAHPCQVLADILTFEEYRGGIEGKTLSWVGDARNNMANSWIAASEKLGFKLKIGAPERFAPANVVGAKNIELTSDPVNAVRGSDCVMTDAWISMSDDTGSIEERRRLLAPYQVNEALMAEAPGALFMHCLPAHRGEEVTDGVLDGEASAALDEVANRIHAQKAVLLYCLDSLT